MSLASALCEHDLWSDVAAYLDACGAFWDDEHLVKWKARVARKQSPPFSHDDC